MTALPFQPGAPRLWTVPAGTPFLRALAQGLGEATDLATRPDALADALIYVPNRRSADALARELYTVAGGGALLVPDIRALGDLEEGDLPDGPETAQLEALAPLSEAERTGRLMQLVRAWYARQGLECPPASAFSAARDLASLLDEAAFAGGIDWSRLAALAERADLARHWQHSVTFLEIITEAWPAFLAERATIDPPERRMAAAQAIAASWQATPPQAPVIIAGSTGATPESRTLMRAALALGKGLIVLPGLDRSLDGAALAEVRVSPSHPQHALARLVGLLGTEPGAISEWPGADPKLRARRRLVHEALLPAGLTGDWIERLDELSPGAPAADFARDALSGLSVLAARDETEEARLAALLLRETLDRPGERAALVTPDASLARRVAALMPRWGVELSPSVGTPLPRTAPGAFMDAVLGWWRAPDDPVAIATLMHCELSGWPADKALFERWALRGVKWWHELDHMAAEIGERLTARDRHRRPDAAGVNAIAADVQALAGLAASLPDEDRLDTQALRAGLSAIITHFRANAQVWSGPDGAALAQLFERLFELAGPLGPLPLDAWHELYRKLACETAIGSGAETHPRLAIWGPLEARLQQADRLILAGLNEDVWPQRPGADAFLPRHFRQQLGLPDREERMGLAAHDFAQLACARNVTLLYSLRREDAPAVASRWVWRLRALARGALGEAAEAALAPPEGANPLAWSPALCEPLRHAEPDHAKPLPRPPVKARPRRLSVTRIDMLQRDPYAIYASEILRLDVLDPLAKPVSPAETGTAIHAALEAFERSGASGDLVAMLEAELARAGEPVESVAGRRAVLAATADWYLQWREGRHDETRFETRGNISFEIEGLGEFTLSAVADRIEIGPDTSLCLIDFKTGLPPSDAQIATGLDQQMPLQALIAEAGGFEDVPAGQVEELVYVAFRARPAARRIGESRAYPATPEELARKAHAGFARLLTGYADPNQSYPAAPRVQFVRYDYGYNRLARQAEWSAETSDE